MSVTGLRTLAASPISRPIESKVMEWFRNPLNFWPHFCSSLAPSILSDQLPCCSSGTWEARFCCYLYGSCFLCLGCFFLLDGLLWSSSSLLRPCSNATFSVLPSLSTLFKIVKFLLPAKALPFLFYFSSQTHHLLIYHKVYLNFFLLLSPELECYSVRAWDFYIVFWGPQCPERFSVTVGTYQYVLNKGHLIMFSR